jgi:hypothetical protein
VCVCVCARVCVSVCAFQHFHTFWVAGVGAGGGLLMAQKAR